MRSVTAGVPGRRPPLGLWGIGATFVVAQLLALAAAVAVAGAVRAGAPRGTFALAYTAFSLALLVCASTALRWARFPGGAARLFSWPGGRWLAVGAAAGVVLKFAADGVARLEILVGLQLRGNNPVVLHPRTFAGPLALVLLGLTLVLLVPLAEELFFRGLLFGWARAYLPGPLAIGVAALVFAAAHGSLTLLPPLTVVGIGLCWLYQTSDSLLPSAVAHALINATALLFAIRLR